jgi:hypothetical protein
MAPDSLLTLRLPAVIWVISTAILVSDIEATAQFDPLQTIAWVVVIGGVVYYFTWLVQDVQEAKQD